MRTLAPWRPAGGVGNCPASSVGWQGLAHVGSSTVPFLPGPQQPPPSPEVPSCGSPLPEWGWGGRPVKARTTHPLTSQILPGGHVFTLATSHLSNSERGGRWRLSPPPTNSRPFPADPKSPPHWAHLPRPPFPSQLCRVGWGGPPPALLLDWGTIVAGKGQNPFSKRTWTALSFVNLLCIPAHSHF